MKKIGYILRPLLGVLIAALVVVGVIYSYNISSTNEVPKNYDVEISKTSISEFSIFVFDENGQPEYDDVSITVDYGTAEVLLDDLEITVLKEGSVTFNFEITHGSNIYQLEKSLYVTNTTVDTYGTINLTGAGLNLDHTDLKLGGIYDVVYDFGNDVNLVIKDSNNPYNDGIIRVMDNDTIEVVGVGTSYLSFELPDGTIINDKTMIKTNFHSNELANIMNDKFDNIGVYRQAEFEKVTSIEVPFYGGIENDLSYLKNVQELTIKGYASTVFEYEIPHLAKLNLETTNPDFTFVDSHYPYLDVLELDEVKSISIINEGLKELTIKNSKMINNVTVECDTLESLTLNSVAQLTIDNAKNLSNLTVNESVVVASIQNTEALQEINFADVNLETITLSNNKNLKSLDLTNGDFTELVIDSDSLETLKITGCKLLTNLSIKAGLTTFEVSEGIYSKVYLENVKANVTNLLTSTISDAEFKNCSKMNVEYLNLSNLNYDSLKLSDMDNINNLTLSKSTSLMTVSDVTKTIELTNLVSLKNLYAANLGLKDDSIIMSSEMKNNLLELDLSFNNLTSFEPTSYKELKYLNLANNNLHYTTSTFNFRIETDSKLEKLDISNTGTVAMSIFAPKLKELNITGNGTDGIFINLKIFSPLEVLETDIKGSHILYLNGLKCDISNFMNITATNASFSNCLYLNSTKLDLSNLIFEKLELSDLNNVEELIIKKMGFKVLGSVSSDITLIDISNMSKLEKLEISGTGLDESELNITPNIYNQLKTINFNNNNLTTFDFNLPNLTDLDLSANCLTSINITEESKIKNLNLSKNALSDVTIKSSEIAKLNISNPMYKLDLSGSIKKLEDIIIDAPLESLNVDVKDGYKNVSLKNLTTANIDNILASTIENVTFENVGYLNNENITFGMATKTLVVSNQTINNLTISASQPLTNIDLKNIRELNALYLSDLMIDENVIDLSNDIQSNLLKLTLNNNKFTTFDLSNYTSLQELDLTNNILEEINIVSSDNIKVLKLSQNLLSGEFNLSNLSNLEKLDLSNNQLESFIIDGTKVSSLNLNNNKEEFKLLDISNTDSLYGTNFNINSNKYDTIKLTNVSFDFASLLNATVDNVTFDNCSYLNSSSISLSNPDFIYKNLNLVNLNRNNIELIQNIFGSKVNLTNISNLKDLSITNIDLSENAFIDAASAANIKYLNLNYCEINEFNNTLYPTLESLNLDGNLLEEIEINSNKLQYMSIAENNTLNKIIINAPLYEINTDFESTHEFDTVKLYNLDAALNNILAVKKIKEVVLDNCSYLNSDSSLLRFDFENLLIQNLKRETIDLKRDSEDITSRIVNIKNIEGLKVLKLTYLGLSNEDLILTDTIKNNLSEIYLGHNNFDTFDFINYPEVRIINLDENNISMNIDLEHNPKLQHLYLSGNDVKSINANLEYLNFLGIKDNLNLKSIDITGPALYTIRSNFVSTHEFDLLRLTNIPSTDLSNLLSVKKIKVTEFDNCAYLELDEAVLNTFDFEELTISNIDKQALNLSKTEKVGTRLLTLNNITNLETLNVNNLGIEHLNLNLPYVEGNLIKTLKNLYANNNDLSFIDIELFASELNILELEDNKLDMNLDVSRFSKLNILKVANNNLVKLNVYSDHLSVFTITGNTELTSLDFASSSFVSEINLSDSVELERVNVFASSINALDLTNNTKLNYIAVNGENITTLTLPQIESIDYVGLTANANVDLSVFTIEISELMLDSLVGITWPAYGVNIPTVSLSNMDAVTSVDLAGNHVINLSLVNLSGITSLDLHDNDLETFTIEKLENLETLNLANNKLTAFEFKNMPKLTTLDLSNNNISTLSYGEEVFELLESINLSGNSISKLVIGSQFPILTGIDLLNNEVVIEEFSLNGQQVLEEIDFSGSTVKILKIENCPKITSLNLPESEEIILKNNSSLTTIGYSPNDEQVIKNLELDNTELLDSLKVDITSVLENISKIDNLKLANITIVSNGSTIKNLVLNGELPNLTLSNISNLDILGYYYINSSTDAKDAERKNLSLENLQLTQLITNYSFESLSIVNCSKISNLNFVTSTNQVIEKFELIDSLVEGLSLSDKLSNIKDIYSLRIDGYKNGNTLDLSKYINLTTLELIDITTLPSVSISNNDFDLIYLDNCDSILSSFFTEKTFNYKTNTLKIKNNNLSSIIINSTSNVSNLEIDNLTELLELSFTTLIDKPSIKVDNVNKIEAVSVDANISSIDGINISNVHTLEFVNTEFANLDLRKDDGLSLLDEETVTAFYNNLTSLTIYQDINVGQLTLANFENFYMNINGDPGMEKLVIETLVLSNITFEPSTLMNFDVTNLTLNDLSTLDYFGFINNLESIEKLDMNTVEVAGTTEFNFKDTLNAINLIKVDGLESIVYNGSNPTSPIDIKIENCSNLNNIDIANHSFNELSIDLTQTTDINLANTGLTDFVLTNEDKALVSTLILSDNELTEFDFLMYVNIVKLDLSNNNIHSFEFTNNANIRQLYLEGNTSDEVMELYIAELSSLEELTIPRNGDFSIMSLVNLPNLSLICFNNSVEEHIIVDELVIKQIDNLSSLDISTLDITLNLSIIGLTNLTQIIIDDSSVNNYETLTIENVKLPVDADPIISLDLSNINSLTKLEVKDVNVFKEIILNSTFKEADDNSILLDKVTTNNITIDNDEISKIEISTITLENSGKLNLGQNLTSQFVDIYNTDLTEFLVKFKSEILYMSDVELLEELEISTDNITNVISLNYLTNLLTLSIDTTDTISEISVNNAPELTNLYLDKDDCLFTNKLNLGNLGNNVEELKINDTNELLINGIYNAEDSVVFNNVNIKTLTLSSYYEFINQDVNAMSFKDMESLYQINLENMAILKDIVISNCGTDPLITEDKELTFRAIDFNLGSETDEILILDGLNEWKIFFDECNNTSSSYVLAVKNISSADVKFKQPTSSLKLLIKPYEDANSIETLNINVESIVLATLDINVSDIGVNNLTVANSSNKTNVINITANPNTNVTFDEGNLGTLTFANDLNQILINKSKFSEINTQKFNYFKIVSDYDVEVVNLAPLSETEEYDYLSSGYITRLNITNNDSSTNTNLSFDVDYDSSILDSYQGRMFDSWKYMKDDEIVTDYDSTKTNITGDVYYDTLFAIQWAHKSMYVTFVNENSNFNNYFTNKTLVFDSGKNNITTGDFTYLEMISGYKFVITNGTEELGSLELPKDYNWLNLPMDIFNDSRFSGFDVKYYQDLGLDATSINTTDYNYYVSVLWTGLNIEYYCDICGKLLSTQYLTNLEVELNPEITIKESLCEHRGYEFSSWTYNGNIYNPNEKHNLSDIKVESSSLISFVSVRTIIYDVVFEENGGQGVSDLLIENGTGVKYGTTFVLPTTTKTGYNFLGWYYDPACTSLCGIAGSQATNITDTANEQVKLYAKWTPITYTVVFETPHGSASNLVATYDNQYSLPNLTTNGYTFEYWETIDGQKVTSINNLSSVNNSYVTLYAKWRENIYYINYDEKGGDAVSNTSVKYTGSITLPTPKRDKSGNTTYSFDHWTYGGNNYGGGSKFYGYILGNLSDGTTITLTASWSSYTQPCITYDTLVLMADGTQKFAKDIQIGDYVITWDLFTGQNVVTQVFFIDDHGYMNNSVNTLVFSDGTTVDTAGEHGFFNMTLNKFVYFTDEIGSEYIGHEFMKTVLNEDGTSSYIPVTLVDYVQEVRTEGLCSLTTAYHYTHYANNMLSIGGAIEGLFNIFEVGEDMKYDEEKMNADIEQYGIFTYEELSDLGSYLEYEITGAKYFKVAIGKGMLTMEQLIEYIKAFMGGDE